jgi:hypothetical protein
MTRAAIIAAAMAAALGASSARAETFTSAEFLKWPEAKQNGYLTASATMTGVIAAQLSKKQARCIDDWYAQQSSSGHQAVRDAMRQYPQLHPQGVILWVVQNACGKIGVAD